MNIDKANFCAPPQTSSENFKEVDFILMKFVLIPYRLFRCQCNDAMRKNNVIMCANEILYLSQV